MIFHTITSEEYYTGFLVLKELNGVTDGSIILYTILIVAGIFGNDIFHIEVAYGWHVREIISFIVTFTQLGMCL